MVEKEVLRQTILECLVLSPEPKSMGRIWAHCRNDFGSGINLLQVKEEVDALVAELKLLRLPDNRYRPMKTPSNRLRYPISELIAKLQALPPGTTYEEQEPEFDCDLGTGYTLKIDIVEGFNPPRLS